jgi:site-specific DNA-methyltransferase (adenine-specific)
MVTERRGEATMFRRDESVIYQGDVSHLYHSWERPIVIISDGPYGVSGFPGDPPTPQELPEWYEHHVSAWAERATPQTTLWFWNTERGWANVHPVLVRHGWTFVSCHIWDKGISHVAGNSNTKTLRRYPVVTEVSVQYVKEPLFRVDGATLTMKEWLRHEWERTGLPFYKANEACSVRNAATRKYLTKDHLWYYPPSEAFEGLSQYANAHGRPEGGPYFSADGERPLTGRQWARMRAKFYCEPGITNVWREPPVRGPERLKNKHKCLHLNQKPLRLIEMCIRASSDEGDVVWEPFGGLCTVGVAAHMLGRASLSAEIDPYYYRLAVKRLQEYDKPSGRPNTGSAKC